MGFIRLTCVFFLLGKRRKNGAAVLNTHSVCRASRSTKKYTLSCSKHFCPLIHHIPGVGGLDLPRLFFFFYLAIKNPRLPEATATELWCPLVPRRRKCRHRRERRGRSASALVSKFHAAKACSGWRCTFEPAQPSGRGGRTGGLVWRACTSARRGRCTAPIRT